jgi:hypothetical protein
LSVRRNSYLLLAGATACALSIAGVFALLLLAAGFDGGAGAAIQAECSIGPSTAGEPALVQYYIEAASQYDLGADGYAYLAAINDVETTFGTNLAVSSAGAIGWMQFEPATWALYAVSVTDPGAPANPDAPEDAIFTAAHYLHASGAPGDWKQAIYTYNHSDAYVRQVESAAMSFMGSNGLGALRAAIAAAWGSKQAPTYAPVTVSVSYDGCNQVEVLDVTPVPGRAAIIMSSGLARPPKDAPLVVQAMVDAGDRIDHFDYQWGGGHAVPQLSDSQTDPRPQGGSEPGQNGTPGYDCSGATDYVLYGGGLGQSILQDTDPPAAGLMSLGDVGQGKWVTWWASNSHVFISVAGIVLDTVHMYPVAPATPSTGPRWQPGGDVKSEQTGDLVAGPFTPRHPQGL